jgi:hypothetical protein
MARDPSPRRYAKFAETYFTNTEIYNLDGI